MKKKTFKINLLLWLVLKAGQFIALVNGTASRPLVCTPWRMLLCEWLVSGRVVTFICYCWFGVVVRFLFCLVLFVS